MCRMLNSFHFVFLPMSVHVCWAEIIALLVPLSLICVLAAIAILSTTQGLDLELGRLSKFT